MFSSTFVHVFGIQVNVAALFGGVPFHWLHKQRRLTYSCPKTLKRFHNFGIRIVACIAYWGIRALQTKVTRHEEDFHLTYLLFSSSIYVFLSYLVILKDPLYWTQVFNGIIRFNDTFYSEYIIYHY